MPAQFAALLVLFCTSMAATVYAQNTEIDTGSVRLVPLAEGVYAVAPNFAGANGALILDDSGHVVVDSHGTPASAQALIDAVKMISDIPVRYVVNSHWHVDHHSGNAAYKSTYGDDIIFISHDETRNEIPTLGADQFEQVAAYRAMPLDAASKALAEPVDAHGVPLSAEQITAIEKFRDGQAEYAEAQSYDYALAELTYNDSMTVHGDNHTVEVFFLHPAHTRSDSIVYLRKQEILIVGDLLTQPILWSWSSFPSSYVQTLKALEALPVKKIVIGHGGPVLEGKAYLILARQFLEAAVGYATESHAAGLSSDKAIEAAAADAKIEAFRRRFVSAKQDSMFDQMVGWTVMRAYAEF